MSRLPLLLLTPLFAMAQEMPAILGETSRSCQVLTQSSGALVIGHWASGYGWRVAIVDPDTFAAIWFRLEGPGTACDLREFTERRVQRPTREVVRVLLHTDVRKAIQSATSDPILLRELLAKQPDVLFASERDKLNGERILVNVNDAYLISWTDIKSTAKGLRELRSSTLESSAKRRLAYLEAEQSEFQAMQRNQAEARARWTAREDATFRPGDMVCTFAGNYFGNIELIDGNRAKVHVIGRVASRSDGFFFEFHQHPGFGYERMDVPRWYQRGEIGTCSFNP